ncbi:MAG: DUF2306 domain-containing protein [Saprospiraceae bacterium]|nr:DUF2306 domain-containing protein [Saprospiraceae bacterium]MCF8250699.1 DUF2306 domain-containing protein [Saprospiraceae bacterium]MCF8283150.1 DUF2306 domain-containing protein [Bacteroidales bacterium]MCF8312551.1 DUF2306 domain-containing protein [Saprospiraceae bacterium]MCF8440769.1 DUF2306 domain-containing protein [Saprospiraceae bacterium]
MKNHRRSFSRFFWVIIIVLSAYYLYRGIHFRFFEEGIGETFWNKQFWYVFHLITAIFPLVLGPFQFWSWFRKHHVHWHRLLGKLYIIGALLGGISAFYLGVTISLEGSRLPLFLLSTLWLFMTTAAWLAIKKKNVKAHRLFMIRSYVLAMVFVILRVMGDVPSDMLFFYIQSPELRDATLEWMSWVLPLLVTEFWISWIPLLKNLKS